MKAIALNQDGRHALRVMDGHVECELCGVFAEPANHRILHAPRHAVDADPARYGNLLSGRTLRHGKAFCQNIPVSHN
jgi:hypothetical protein